MIITQWLLKQMIQTWIAIIIYIINSRTKHATTLLSQKWYEKAEPEDIITDTWEVTNLNKKILFGDSN